MDQSRQGELLAAIVVLLTYHAGDLPADLYPAYERARAIAHGYVEQAASQLVGDARG